MWSAKLENYTSPEKHEACFLWIKWNISDLRTDSSYEFRYPRWNPCLPSLHHLSPFGKYPHQLFTISFHKSRWFQFFAGALKNVLSRRLSAFWARVGRVIRTKQLFCHGLMVGTRIFTCSRLLVGLHWFSGGRRRAGFYGLTLWWVQTPPPAHSLSPHCSSQPRWKIFWFVDI